MKYGDLVKIDDIGQPAIFIRRNGDGLELELCGERFWMPASLVSLITEDGMMAA